MPGQTQVQIIGTEKVQAALRRLPLVIRPLYERAAKYGQGRMKRHARPRYGEPAKLAEGVVYTIKGEAGKPYSLSAHVGFLGRGHGVRSSLGALAPTVNYGRRPGRPPSIAAIHAWLRKSGLHVSPRTTVERIRERGTKGKLFMEHTAEDLAQKLPEIVRQTEAEIQARWG